MPTLPFSQCCEYGCKANSIKGSRFCREHTPAKETPVSQKREMDEQYRTVAWKQIRMAQLSKEPLCACCSLEGRLSVADAVDHVFPWKMYGQDAFRRNYFQSLCKPDHTRKTALENKGIFRHYTADGIKDYKYEDYSYLINDI